MNMLPGLKRSFILVVLIFHALPHDDSRKPVPRNSNYNNSFGCFHFICLLNTITNSQCAQSSGSLNIIFMSQLNRALQSTHGAHPLKLP